MALSGPINVVSLNFSIAVKVWEMKVVHSVTSTWFCILVF